MKNNQDLSYFGKKNDKKSSMKKNRRKKILKNKVNNTREPKSGAQVTSRPSTIGSRFGRNVL